MEEQENGENVGMLVLEAKSLRPFRTKDEYLYAMKEDLAEWFTCLYKEIDLNADNFLEVLETGVLLCQHANEVRKFTDEQRAKGTLDIKSNFVRDIRIPEYNVQFKIGIKPGTFLARDNISNFITWTTKMGIPEVLRFETDDLVLRKNERSVVLCLLEVARVGAKFGMLAPTIVQMEEEIDNEIETGEPPPQIKTCDVKSLDEMVRELVGRCTCPVQFPIIKVGEGKYKIGDNQTLVFVRILRKHVMIRVGGGWDTLEHYLDRHDPCRCGFQGHRGGRGSTTPRRQSTANASKSLPGTPKTSRKLSLTTPSSTHSGSTARPASPSMRSASPGPNSKKLSVTIKGNHSQPPSCVTSPSVSKQDISFSNSGLNSSGKIQTGLNSSGNFPLGSFVKQSHANLTRQLSSSSTGSQSHGVGPSPRRCNSPSPRPQSPSQRRSESPKPNIAARLRSPSPAVSTQKQGTNPSRPQSVPATQRCTSPMKQITLSELRSSREGKPGGQSTPRTVNRQISSESVKSKGSDSEMMADQNNPNLTIDKISTMSLGEFRNLLNSALSVPNGHADSQCSSDSPRSQGSVDSCKNPSKGNKSTPTKSAYSYRSVSAGRNQTIKPTIPAKPNFAHNKSDTTSVSNQRSHSAVRSSGYGQVRSSGYGQVRSSGYGQDNRPKTPNSMLRSRSNTSSISETSNTNLSNSRSNFASRSSSHSSIHSYESTDDGRNTLSTENGELTTKVLSPSSVDSDYSFRGSSSSDYARSNSYTPCSISDEKLKMNNQNSGTRASSEPKESISSISNDIQNAYGVPEVKPINVGYASFSYDKEEDVKEIDEIGGEIMNSRTEARSRTVPNTPERETPISNMRPQTPTGRRTPSFLPRPVTPKMSRKLSLPQNNDSNACAQNENKSNARPPTPKKSTIMARAHAPVPASSNVRSADRSKEQTYREIFHKRSTTPGPGSSSSNDAVNYGRSMTPGPYLQKTSTLKTTSATTNRAEFNQAREQNRDVPLSIYDGEANKANISNSGSRTPSVDRKVLTKQKSLDSEAVIVVNVNRSEGKHSISVQGESGPRQSSAKPKVLARARTEESRARQPARTMPNTPRQRPQSVEPRQLISNRTGAGKDSSLSVKRNENGQKGAYDRTTEWVQSAVEQTKVKKPKVAKAYDPRMRRAMTPNSFDMRIDKEPEEPRTLDEIKAALSLPINGVIDLNTEELDAPPEDSVMYAEMEKLFHELRQQELKNSVNETPGSSTSGGKAGRSKSKSSKSNSTNNDEEMSVDSNKNLKHKTYSTSTKSSSNMTSPMVQRSAKAKVDATQTRRSQATSRTSSVSSSSNTRGGVENTSTPSTPRRSSARSSISNMSNNPRPSSPGPALVTKRPPSPRTASQPPRPASPRVTAQPPRPSSPKVTTPPRPASPRVPSQPPRPASPRISTNRPSSPSPQITPSSSRGSTPSRSQPPRPASTPPRSYQPISRVSSRSSEESDSVFEKENRDESGNLISKLKEIIKVNPRKAKDDNTKSKTRIPAPKSLSSAGKSQSFSNLSNLSQTLTVANEEDMNGYDYDGPDSNCNGDFLNGGLSSTMPGKVDSVTPKWTTPLTTGRSSLIRKESMEKNKTSNRLVRAMSVERNLGMNGTYHYYDEGEYV
ncbi:cytoskeletal adaptor [Mactra antiquata]